MRVKTICFHELFETTVHTSSILAIRGVIYLHFHNMVTKKNRKVEIRCP